MISASNWTFTRIDERTLHVTCPTFSTPLELTLNSTDRKILAFYALAADLMAAEPVAQVVSSGPANFPLLQWMSADISFGTPIGSKLYVGADRG